MILISQQAGGQVVAPAICFVCEHHFDAEHRFVDTGRSYLYSDDVHDLVTHLHGVKYICEHCAIGAASVVLDTDLRERDNERVELERRLAVAEQQLADVEEMDDQVVAQLERIVNTRTWNRPGPKPGNARMAKLRGDDEPGA